MTKRALLVLICAIVLLLCALSTRGELFWLLFWLLCIMLLVNLAATIWAFATLRISSSLGEESVERTSQVELQIEVSHRCLLPIAALRLQVSALSEAGSYSLYLPVKPLTNTTKRYALYCPHVGAYPSGVSQACVRDVFGLFSLVKNLPMQRQELLVLPQVYATTPLVFSTGDSDNENASARAFEDATLPTDLRAFQQGDELKKVHWKLSMRRKEILVRVYEQPQRPDALLLVDCAPPDAATLSMQSAVRDAICEAAASVATTALQDGSPVRMPLLAELPVDINASRAEDVETIRTALARCKFDGAQQFERVLLLETRRMRRTGSTAIVTSRMNPVLADMILRIRRMGPKVRVLTTADQADETVALMVTRLMRNDVEVEAIEASAG